MTAPAQVRGHGVITARDYPNGTVTGPGSLE
jgi:hypothetical protein